MASLVNVTSVDLLNNPAPFNDKLNLSISFNCLEAVNKPLSFDIVYIGSPNDTDHDQVLDTITVPELTVGNHTITIEVDPPVADKIPKEDFVGVTAIMLKAFYNGQLFNKISWYCAIEYTDPELIENQPETPVIEKLQRRVVFDEPRNVIYNIKWKENEEEEEVVPTEEVEESDVIVFSCQPSEFDIAAEKSEDKECEEICQEMDDTSEMVDDEQMIEEDDNKSVDLENDSDISMDEDADDDETMGEEMEEEVLEESLAAKGENEVDAEMAGKKESALSEPFSDKTNDSESAKA
uniref:Histone chaperone asf1 n=1 Tax=Strongyloides papillosus TaxID=174720 RepID=A0A0N5BWZ5_STREA